MYFKEASPNYTVENGFKHVYHLPPLSSEITVMHQ